MRFLLVPMKVLAWVVLLGATGWTAARFVLGAALRGLERDPVVRAGRDPRAGWLICGAGIAALGAVVLLALVVANLVDRLLPDQEGWVGFGGRWYLALLLFFFVVAAAWGAWDLVREAERAARRRAILLRCDPPIAEAAPAPRPRRIVILCDGTGNDPTQQEDGQPAVTNVWRLSRLLEQDEAQTVWYRAGVGTDAASTSQGARRVRAALEFAGTGQRVAAGWPLLRKLMQAVTGAGISAMMTEAYREIVTLHRPGDRIYLVGFSRGAYAARCVAGVVARCGLLRAENARFAGEVVQFYRSRRNPDDPVPVNPALIHENPEIHFLGAFDTVASLGAPLWGWWFRVWPVHRNASFDTDPAGVCLHVRHALAMDERRSQYFPTPFARPKSLRDGGSFRQFWFRGVHADVGGGYARTGLSDIALGWMMREMRARGLRFREGAFAELRPDPLAHPHDELRRNPHWRVFGSWPRWHPVPGGVGPDNGESALHPSVIERAAALHRLGRDDLRRLARGATCEFTVPANAEWHRTGLVIEPGSYRLTYLGGTWRDGEAHDVRPDGTPADGGAPAAGGGFFARRLPKVPALGLMATVAHPRDWPPREFGFWRFCRYLLAHDPPALTGQLAFLGQDLAKPGDAVVIRNDAEAGMLHLFGNDGWLDSGNNSGGLRLRLERLPDGEAPSGPLVWTLKKPLPPPDRAKPPPDPDAVHSSWERTAPIDTRTPRCEASPVPHPG